MNELNSFFFKLFLLIRAKDFSCLFYQGRRQKNFQEGWSTEKIPKIALLSLFQGG